ncbi:hypothetical protein GCM10023237_07250 [Streptomyces coeruleoprunus]
MGERNRNSSVGRFAGSSDGSSFFAGSSFFVGSVLCAVTGRTLPSVVWCRTAPQHWRGGRVFARDFLPVRPGEGARVPLATGPAGRGMPR